MTEQEHKSWFARFYSRFWYIPDIVFIGFVLLPINAMPVVQYIAGLHSDGAMLFGVCMLLAVLMLPAFICLLILAIRLMAIWPAHIHNRRRLWLLRIVTIAWVGIFLVLPFEIMGSGLFMRGSTEYVKADADMPAIRAWLSELDPNICTGEIMWMYRTYDRNRLANLPQSVTSLNPRWVQLHLDRDKYPAIRLEWGGFDDSWGVEIGPEDMEIPETLPRREVKIGDSTMHELGEYRRPVVPGVYV